MSPALMAYAYVALGEKQQAMTWLEKAYKERQTFVGSLKIVPALDPLRSEPRFISLIHQLGLPE